MAAPDLILLLERLHQLASGRPLYLVGGSVRDLLMNHMVKDVDVALPGPVSTFGKRAAKALGGSFFYLREADDTARIVLSGKNSEPDSGVSQVDLVALHGSTLEEDLRRRDFTVNAMGLDLTHYVPDLNEEAVRKLLVDPFDGWDDLLSGCIRRCTPQSLADDPLRTLRAVRFAAGFGWRIEDETRLQVRETGPLLAQVSAERIRDELFQMLQLPPERTMSALHWLEKLDLMGHALRGSAASDGMARVQRLHDHVSMITLGGENDFNPSIQAYLEEILTPPRTRYGALKLAALLGAPTISEEVQGDRKSQQQGVETFRSRLELSAGEAQYIRKVWNLARHLNNSPQELTLDPVTIHRWFRQYGDAIPGGLFLAAADDPSWRDSPIEKAMLHAWFEECERYLPQPLLNGNDLKERYHKPGGPWVAKLLDGLLEAQVSGEVQNPDDAWVYAEKVLTGEG